MRNLLSISAMGLPSSLHFNAAAVTAIVYDPRERALRIHDHTNAFVQETQVNLDRDAAILASRMNNAGHTMVELAAATRAEDAPRLWVAPKAVTFITAGMPKGPQGLVDLDIGVAGLMVPRIPDVAPAVIATLENNFKVRPPLTSQASPGPSMIWVNPAQMANRDGTGQSLLQFRPDALEMVRETESGELTAWFRGSLPFQYETPPSRGIAATFAAVASVSGLIALPGAKTLLAFRPENVRRVQTNPRDSVSLNIHFARTVTEPSASHIAFPDTATRDHALAVLDASLTPGAPSP